MLACPCDRPPEQRFPSVNRSFQIEPRHAYSLRRWNALASEGRAGSKEPAAAAAAAGSRKAGCGDPISQECWTCPESAGLDFVDPIRSIKRCVARLSATANLQSVLLVLVWEDLVASAHKSK